MGMGRKKNRGNGRSKGRNTKYNPVDNKESEGMDKEIIIEKEDNAVEIKDCKSESNNCEAENNEVLIEKVECAVNKEECNKEMDKKANEEELNKKFSEKPMGKKEYKTPLETKVECKVDKKVSKADESKSKVKEEKENLIESIKHPLENVWGMWLYTNESKNWLENHVMLTCFDTVEDFWCLYHYMKTPSELQIGKDYAVFKNGIKPTWEDAANEKGGRWLVSFDKRMDSHLDSIWLSVVLLVIGENFPCPDMICGAVVNVRTKSKIAVWVKNIYNQEAIIQVGKTLRDRLGLRGRLAFQQHNLNKQLHIL